MYYIAEFASRTEDIYKIWIDTGETPSDPIELTLSGNPCDISTKSEGLFAPIKSRGCTIEIVTKTYYPDLYNPTSRGAKLTVTKNPDTDNEVVFRGYLTPCSYDQTFTYIDEVSLEAVDAVSTAKDFKWSDTYQYEYFSDIIIGILKDCGYEGNLYVPQSFEAVNSQTITNDDIIDKLMISSGNFIQDDDLKTGLTLYEVLEEILRYLGWSLVPDGDNVWLIDYRLLNTGNSVWSIYDIQTGVKSNETFTQPSSHLIELDDRAAGTSKYSLDDVYNKIEISDNLYEIDEISPDIFEDKNHISINQEKEFDFNSVQWEKTEKSGWWLWKKETQKVIGTDYQTICRIAPGCGWTHYYYNHSTILDADSQPLPNADGKGYYLENSGNTFESKPINKYCNTHGCLIQHYAFTEQITNFLPSSLDWEKYLTFFVCNPTTPQIKYTNLVVDIPKLERKVLEYETTEEMFFKPASGTSWITIKGDLFYQNNKGTYGEKDKDVFEVVNYDKLFYITSPADKAIDISEQHYLGLYRTEADYPNYYYSGFPCWKMSVQVGDKFWTSNWNTSTHQFDGQWVTKENPSDPDPTFYIHYNNNPQNNEEEYLPAFKWISPVNNKNYKDKVGIDGYCIPIASNDDDAPTHGKLKVTIYTPCVIPSTMIPIIQAYYQLKMGFSQSWLLSWVFTKDSTFERDTIPWVIFAKDFEIGYCYTDTQEWYYSHDDTNKNDKVYTGYIDDNYVKDMSKIQLKVNSTSKDKPISKSYVTTQDVYVEKMKHKCGTLKEQEYNVVDLYLDHHSDKRPIYNTSLHEYRKPYDTFSTSYITGNFMVDKQNYDLNKDNNSINLVAF